MRKFDTKVQYLKYKYYEKLQSMLLPEISWIAIPIFRELSLKATNLL